ncbi:hypothetical protein XENOCAPTIV_016557 [Xenoophorus captivus]|uniref:Uncharacterized protein n=1 Tax=Xenoophorus captivus TaxID=1517983 RepID=A0ABV0R462_9TELE
MTNLPLSVSQSIPAPVGPAGPPSSVSLWIPEKLDLFQKSPSGCQNQLDRCTDVVCCVLDPSQLIFVRRERYLDFMKFSLEKTCSHKYVEASVVRSPDADSSCSLTCGEKLSEAGFKHKLAHRGVATSRSQLQVKVRAADVDEMFIMINLLKIPR